MIMKKISIVLIILILINLRLFAGNEKLELKTSVATLTINSGENLKIIQDPGQMIQVNSSLNQLWKIVVINSLNEREFSFSPDKNFTITKVDGIIRIVVNIFALEDKALPFIAEFTISVKDDAFCFSGSLESKSEEWILKELDFPVLSGIRINDEKTGIYWPVGLGQYFDDPQNFGSRSIRYPSGSGAAMAWFSINSFQAGLYVGSHDPLQETRVFNLAYDKSVKTFKAFINSTIYAKAYKVPDMVVKPYAGEWYQASKFYRDWYDKHFKIATPPQWVKDDSGWLLAILKQRDMKIMWSYKDIDKLCDIADRFNLNTIGLFGWTIGGHDNLCPYFDPDNRMGGRDELKKAIERAHTRGKKIILYANGKVIDTSTDYYRYNGFETIVIQENRKPEIQFYPKQKHIIPVIFAQACTGSEVWRKTMHNLGLQFLSLGADGIIYDQVGVMWITLCFSKNHDHLPGMSDARNRLPMISNISQEMKKINPEYIVMTEGTNDVIIRGIDFHHGWGVGTAPAQNAFPELFRFTFPELRTTQRNPNPMITRADANFATVNGLRHEIETRYAGDVEYLNHGTLPTPESYADIVSPPNLAKMNLVSADEATKYVHDLIGFEKENADFFRVGKFIARDGIEVAGEEIAANGFLNGSRIGVVVWNKNLTGKRNFSVSVPGYRLISASEPGKAEVSASSQLDANSIRLLQFKKEVQ